MKFLFEIAALILSIILLAVPSYHIAVEHGPAIGWATFMFLSTLWGIWKKLSDFDDFLQNRNVSPSLQNTKFDELKISWQNFNEMTDARNSRIIDELVEIKSEISDLKHNQGKKDQ